MRELVSHARLLELLAYDPETGIFTRKIGWRRYKVGEIAGTPHPDGYWFIKIDDRSYRAHRLAWFYVTGRWAPILDHQDGDKTNNRFANLREATVSQNNCNKSIGATNKSGFKGVHWDKASGKWRAVVTLNRKNKTIGRYDRIEDAVAAYKDGAAMVHGEFARVA